MSANNNNNNNTSNYEAKIKELKNMVNNSFKSLKILLIHGLLDENVHYHHSARLVDKFISNDFHGYQHIILPNDRHSFTSKNIYVYYFRLLTDFFKANLLMPSTYYSPSPLQDKNELSSLNIFTKNILPSSCPIKSDHKVFL